MGLIDYTVLGGVAAAVICAVFWLVRGKKKGRSGCGVCPYAKDCMKEKDCVNEKSSY
jgi:hypothetical protein